MRWPSMILAGPIACTLKLARAISVTIPGEPTKTRFFAPCKDAVATEWHKSSTDLNEKKNWRAAGPFVYGSLAVKRDNSHVSRRRGKHRLSISCGNTSASKYGFSVGNSLL